MSNLGPQFEQLPLLMTRKEIGDLRAGDFGMRPVREVSSADMTSPKHMARVQESVRSRGIEEPVRVLHSQAQPGLKVLYDGHHRAVTAMEQNRLLPVTHYDNARQVVSDIMNSPTWVRDHS